MKKLIFLLALICLLFLNSISFAADIKAILDSNDGSTGLKVINSSGTTVVSIDSSGNADLGGTIHNESTDFTLSNASHGRGDPGSGRALVHAPGNQLTLNYANDFTGGTNIYGSPVYIPYSVGIGSGVTAPNYTLDVNGKVGIRGDQLLFAGGSGLGSDQGDSTATLYNRASLGPTLSGLNMAFRTGPTPAEIMRITSAGNVGIGTTSPSAKLTLQGGNMSVFGTTWEKLRLGQNSDNGFLSLWNSGGTQSVQINSSGSSYLNGGNVGIGTTNPIVQLHVVDQGLNTLKTAIYGGSSGIGLYGEGTGTGGTGVYGYALVNNGVGVWGIASSTTGKGVYGNGYYGGYFTGTYGIYSNSGLNYFANKIGINNTNPSAWLQINTPGGNGAMDGIAIYNSGTNGRTLTINQGSGGKLNFTNPSVLDLMTLDFIAGSVGINNTSPSSSYVLDVNGNTRISGNLQANGYVYMPSINAGSTSYTMYWNSGDGRLYRTSSSRRYKHDIKDYVIDTNKIMQLRPVTFKWNQNTATPNKSDFGMIAEEVNKIFPEIVIYNSSGEADALDYAKLSVILLKDLQKKTKELDEIKSRLKAIEEKIGK